MPLADTRLNENDGRPPAYIAGAIDDEQGKFNLRNLNAADGVDRSELEVLRRLLTLIRIDESFAEPDRGAHGGRGVAPARASGPRPGICR